MIFRRKTFRFLTVFVICLMLMVSVVPVRKAEGAPVIVLAGMWAGICIMTSIVVSAGVEFVDTGAFQAMLQDFRAWLPNKYKDKIDQAVDVAVATGEHPKIDFTAQEMGELSTLLAMYEQGLTVGEVIPYDKYVKIGDVTHFPSMTFHTPGQLKTVHQWHNNWANTSEKRLSIRTRRAGQVTHSWAYMNVITMINMVGDTTHPWYGTRQNRRRINIGSGTSPFMGAGLGTGDIYNQFHAWQDPSLIYIEANPAEQYLILRYGDLYYEWTPTDGYLYDIEIGSINASVESYDHHSTYQDMAMTIPSGWSISADDYIVTDLLQNPVYYVGDVTLQTPTWADSIDLLAGLQAQDISVSEAILTEMGWLEKIWSAIRELPSRLGSTATDVPTDIAIDVTTPAEDLIGKTPFGPLQQTMIKLTELDTAQGQAPHFKINLNALVGSADVIHGQGKTGFFPKEEYTLLDFAVLDNPDHKYGGYTIIQIIRLVLTFGMIYMTIMYCWRKAEEISHG